MSQKNVLLMKLREGPVCSFDFYRLGSGLTHRMGARIYELRREGYAISTRPCHHDWHQAAAVEYVLEMNGKLF